MPFRIFTTTGFRSWIPADDGISDGTTVRLHAVGAGANGSNAMAGGGGGGAGGERASSEVTIGTASTTLSLYIAPANDTWATYCDDGMGFYLVSANAGVGPVGGTGGTGNLYTHAGGAGGTGGTVLGGGGGAGGADGAAGNSGVDGNSGSGGGAGQTQLGVSSAGGGGAGGGANSNGAAGTLYGGGGGGGGDSTGLGGAGKQGIVIAAWGASLLSYPSSPLGDGFVDDPATSLSSAWWLLAAASVLGFVFNG